MKKTETVATVDAATFGKAMSLLAKVAGKNADTSVTIKDSELTVMVYEPRLCGKALYRIPLDGEAERRGFEGKASDFARFSTLFRHGDVSLIVDDGALVATDGERSEVFGRLVDKVSNRDVVAAGRVVGWDATASASVDVRTLRGCLASCAASVSKEKQRPVLTKLHLKWRDGRFLMESSDRFRLSRAYRVADAGAKLECLVMPQLIKALPMGATVLFEGREYSDARISVDALPGLVLSVEWGVFPAMERCLIDEAEAKTSSVVSGKALAEAVAEVGKAHADAVAKVGKEPKKWFPVFLRFRDGGIDVADEAGVGERVVSADVTGEERVVAFNSAYLLDAIASAHAFGDGDAIVVYGLEWIKPWYFRLESDSPADGVERGVHSLVPMALGGGCWAKKAKKPKAKAAKPKAVKAVKAERAEKAKAVKKAEPKAVKKAVAEPEAITQEIAEVPPKPVATKVVGVSDGVKVREIVIPSGVACRDIPELAGRERLRHFRDSRGRKLAYVAGRGAGTLVAWREIYVRGADVDLEARVMAAAAERLAMAA